MTPKTKIVIGKLAMAQQNPYEQNNKYKVDDMIVYPAKNARPFYMHQVVRREFR